jgi:hypothetical protein
VVGARHTSSPVRNSREENRTDSDVVREARNSKSKGMTAYPMRTVNTVVIRTRRTILEIKSRVTKKKIMRTTQRVSMRNQKALTPRMRRRERERRNKGTEKRNRNTAKRILLAVSWA